MENNCFKCFRRLDGNPLNCDCDIAWLSTMAQESKNKSLQVKNKTIFNISFKDKTMVCYYLRILF